MEQGARGTWAQGIQKGPGDTSGFPSPRPRDHRSAGKSPWLLLAPMTMLGGGSVPAPSKSRGAGTHLPNLSLLLKSAPLLNSKLRHSTFLRERSGETHEPGQAGPQCARSESPAVPSDPWGWGR